MFDACNSDGRLSGNRGGRNRDGTRGRHQARGGSGGDIRRSLVKGGNVQISVNVGAHVGYVDCRHSIRRICEVRLADLGPG